jgi:hypothetical protein
MDLHLSNSPEMRFEAGRSRTATSAHFSERARWYRLAGALMDRPRDTEMFLDLAMMFDRLAYDFRRLETAKRRPRNCGNKEESSPLRLAGRSDKGNGGNNGDRIVTSL